MDARGLVRSVGVLGAARGVRSAWRRSRADAVALPRPGAERARVPGAAEGAEPRPGGGVVRFARSSLLVRVTVGGAVFCGWDGAGPEPSYALAHGCPAADARAELEPDTEGGWRVVSERMTVAVSHRGAVEFRTPGGVVLRRDLPPRWWDPVDTAAAGPPAGGGSRWTQCSRVAADARFFGLGARATGPRLPDGAYRLWNTDPGGAFGPGSDPLPVTMPVQLVVADAGTHLVFHDNSWNGWARLREGAEGAGSGHDRPGSCELRFDGGPVRSWTVVGGPARVLRGWTALTGAPALPPGWAFGHQHACGAYGGDDAVGPRAVAAAHRELGLPLSALHVSPPGLPARRRGGGGPAGETARGAGHGSGPSSGAGAGTERVRLVTAVRPAVRAERGDPVYDGGVAAGAFVRDARGRAVRGLAAAGEAVFPDFTDARVRTWWGGLLEKRLPRGTAGLWLDGNEPLSLAAFGDATLPLSARHALDGREGDHREAHNVYGLLMARAAHEYLFDLRPRERPFLVSRAGWAGTQRYGGVVAGPAVADWRGLRASLSLVLGLGLCGVPYCGPDVGGGEPLPAELFLRWFQLAAYLPLFRTRSADGHGGAGPREPWDAAPWVLEHARAALAGRERLLPYFLTLARIARRTGAPYVRPLWWGTPADRRLRDCGDAFLLGDALLVAPVLEPGAVRRAVRLPRGRWYDTVTGDVHEGPGTAVLEAPLSRIPVLARAGAVLPVASPAGGMELEVWAPAPGRTGRGVFAAGTGDGSERSRFERFTTRREGGRVVVEREGGGEIALPLRIRGI
ncbi:glycosyl hydrolase [Streptomyces sp. F63]|uniref:TIM-barrel domain-containing protein n=1 Tax=Streptomyces sp. F63 TaxID=2824887 RepID=UPI001B35CCDF|nr:TIM-barrel domain-containing protein [Streptomyces sp. F63]MBQ0988152.1 glycosyl hydrolase [Streptomyces sp. F63]